MINKIFITYFILTLKLFSFYDNDFDGVDDRKDKCLNTPFVDIVDLYGCSQSNKYIGSFNLELEYLKQKNKILDMNINSIYLDYRYSIFLFSIFYNQYMIDSKTYLGDVYINFGYDIIINENLLNIYFGLKQATGNKVISTKENDYSISLSYEYFINTYFSYLIFVSYTKTGDNQINKYNDFLNYSLGITYVKNKHNISLYYLYDKALLHGANNDKGIEIEYIYSFNTKYYIKLTHAKSLLDGDIYDTSFAIGVHFE
jgi:hypothetical protein